MPAQNETSEIIYSWNCNTVEVYPTLGDNTNVIYLVNWNVTGRINYLTNLITSTKSGDIELNTENLQNFIPFNQITSEQTTDWAKATMGESQVSMLEDMIASEIESLKNPVSITMVVPDPPITNL